MKTPLNGTKTHPLTKHALSVLRNIAGGPVPRQSINAGVADRLEREDLVEGFQKPSPYMIHGGKDIVHLRITAAGLTAIRKAEGR